MTVKNYPLLWKIYDHISAHPEEWRQQSWALKWSSKAKLEANVGWWARRESVPACGTAFCFAGHTVNISRPDVEFAWFRGDAKVQSTAYVKVSDGNCMGIDVLAAMELGLTEREACHLFYGSNTLQAIHDIIRGWEMEEVA
jgi:hypothetical protein